MKVNRWIIAVVGMGLLVTGCVHVSEPDEGTLSVAVPDQWGGTSEAGNPDGWIADFRDPQLEVLVGEALAENLQLQGAVARLDQAMALARIEGAERWPTLSLSGSARRQLTNSLSDPLFRTRSDRFGLDAVASWEVDLWGRVRAGTEAAASEALAAVSDYRGIRLSLASRVAQAWFTAIEAGLQEALARETVASFESNLATVEERFQRGLSPALDLRLTRANVASARSTLALQERLADTAVRQLEVLLGRYPGGTLEIGGKLPGLEEAIPAGLPSELLGRRPDIQASARRLMATDARLLESQRALLPSINLTGSYGRASRDLDNLLENSFDVWSLVGGLTAPLFQGGRLRANVDRSEAALAEALATYRDTVLTAFREVETALAGEVYLRSQRDALETAAEESIGAQELAEERYSRGLVDIITVLESQRRAFNSRSAVLTAESLLLQNRLSLYLSLGGDLR